MRTLTFLLMLAALATRPLLAETQQPAAETWSATVLHWVESGRPQFHLQFETLIVQNRSLRFQFDHFPAGNLRGFEQYWINWKPQPLVKEEKFQFDLHPGVISTNRDLFLAGADFHVKITSARLFVTQRSYLGGTDKHLTFVRYLPVKTADIELGTIWHMNAKQSRSPDSYVGPSLTLGQNLRIEGGVSVTAKRGYFYGFQFTHVFK